MAKEKQTYHPHIPMLPLSPMGANQFISETVVAMP